MSDINKKLCGTCGLTPTAQNRLITEDCGHQKCRKCFLNEINNCWQCNSNTEITLRDNDSEKTATLVDNVSITENPKETNASEDYELNDMKHIKEIRSVDDIVKYHCLECNKIFNSRSQKYYHLDCNRSHKRKYSCDKCEKIFAKYSYLKYHLESHTTVEHKCLQCHKTFRNRLVLRKHEKLHQMQSKTCPECQKDFRTSESLAIHIAAKHSKQLPYNCQQCNKSYACKSTLQQHYLKHQAKKYHCEMCGKRFQRNSTLNFHLKRHNRTETYSCSICLKIFTDVGAQQRHIKEHQNSKRYLCKLCETTTLRKDNMLRHVRNFHIESTFEESVQTIDACIEHNSDELNENNGNLVLTTVADTSIHTTTHTAINSTSTTATTTTGAGLQNIDATKGKPVLKTIENSSVIKCVGNVEPMKVPNLPLMPARTVTPPSNSQAVDTDFIPLTTVNHQVPPQSQTDYNCRKPPKKFFNIELYRRILEASDNEEEDNCLSNANTNTLQSDKLNSDNITADTQHSHCDERPTKAVHWRKSFKYNYELTEF